MDLIGMRRLLSSQIIWLAARLAGASAGFAFQFCLARIMTPRDLGIFFSASSLAAILGIVATQGYPGIAARFISRYAERRRHSWLTDFHAGAHRAMLGCALAVGAAVIVVAMLLPGLDVQHRLAFAYAGLSVPAIAALTALAAFGVAQRQFITALLPDLLLRSALLAAFGGIAFFVGAPLDAGGAMLAFLAITLAVAMVQAVLIGLRWPTPGRTSRLARRWRREAWTLLVVMLFTSFFGDLAIVSATPFLAPADVASFGLIIKIAMIVGFGVQIAHQIMLPDLSDFYARRRAADLAPVLLKGALFPVAFSGTAVLLTLLFGSRVLRLYGPQFEYAAGPLVLLVACQLIRALAGPSQNVLTLEGRQTTNLAICCAASLVLVAGNLFLARSFGLWGAVAAATAAYLVWVVASAVVLRLKGDVATDVISLMAALPAAQPARQPS